MPDLSAQDINYFTGRLLTLIEGWSSNETQTKARKDVAKELIKECLWEVEEEEPSVEAVERARLAHKVAFERLKAHLDTLGRGEQG